MLPEFYLGIYNRRQIFFMSWGRVVRLKVSNKKFQGPDLIGINIFRCLTLKNLRDNPSALVGSKEGAWSGG